MKSKVQIIKFFVIQYVFTFIVLWGCGDKKLPKTDAETVHSVALQWNDALNNHRMDSLQFMYAGVVNAYGVEKNVNSLIGDKEDFIRMHPDFKHSINNVSPTQINDGLYRVNFTKEVSYGDTEMSVEGFIILQQQGDKWLIISESDEPTERKIEQAKNNETTAKHAVLKTVEFEQKITVSGKLATTAYTDASGNKYTVYILNLDEAMEVVAPNRDYMTQQNVTEIQVGFKEKENPKYFIGRNIKVTGEIYGEETIHDRRPVVMIRAVIEK